MLGGKRVPFIYFDSVNTIYALFACSLYFWFELSFFM